MGYKLGMDTFYLHYFRSEIQEKISDFVMHKIIQAQNETLEKQVTIDFVSYQCEIENFIQELIEREVKNEKSNSMKLGKEKLWNLACCGTFQRY